MIIDDCINLVSTVYGVQIDERMFKKVTPKLVEVAKKLNIDEYTVYMVLLNEIARFARFGGKTDYSIRSAILLKDIINLCERYNRYLEVSSNGVERYLEWSKKMFKVRRVGDMDITRALVQEGAEIVVDIYGGRYNKQKKELSLIGDIYKGVSSLGLTTDYRLTFIDSVDRWVLHEKGVQRYHG